ncbi:MAG TPA: FtsQ-type POTRA domain-containing protein [Luteolibacter sp.]|nr:FtsQ-type POTRA domain-containing protein [Luteolibacter sp.]
MKHRTSSRTRRRQQPNVLEVRVMSPRLAWLGLLRFLGVAAKIAVVLAILGGAGYGIWKGVHHTFHQNPDFRLQVIDLNANPVIDEAGLIALAGIDLSSQTSLFDIDVNRTRQRLEELPAVLSARVERHLPGTLLVRLDCRTPKAWVATTGSGNPGGLRVADGLLIDATGWVYPCPERQIEESKKLPVILLGADPAHPIASGKCLEHPELRFCMKLLQASEAADPQSLQWIESIRQANEWSLRLVTRQGTSATFGLSDHEAQIRKLRLALDHSAQKGYVIDTINLIPRFNVPITVRESPEVSSASPARGAGAGLSRN